MATSATLASPNAVVECETQQAPDHGPDTAASARDASRLTFVRAIADIPADAVSCIAWFLHTPPPPPRPPSPPLRPTGLISSATAVITTPKVRLPAPMTTSEAVATATAEGLILMREHTTSGYRNVYRRQNSKYKVAIERNGKQHCLGCFFTPEEAALCAARWMRDHPSGRKHRRITASAGLQLLRSTNSQTLRDHVVAVPTPPLSIRDEDDYLDALIYDDGESSVADGRTKAPII